MKSLYQPEENVNPVSLDIDGLPFIDALEKTVDKKWGGILRVMKEDEQIGSVFMRGGQVAWAVSRNQTENFGSFLERIGLIPKEKLSEIVNRYKALGKSKKLGTLLEEEGLISHAKLRECLRAHIRAAIASMMDDPEVVIKASHGEMVVDSNLIFFLNEVLPKYSNADESGDDSFIASDHPENRDLTGDTDKLVDMLGNLALLPGYRYSFIAESNGNLLALHKSETDSDLGEAVSSAIAWLNSAATHAANGHFGKMESIILEHEKGFLIAQSTNNERQSFVNASFDKDGKLGVIKHKISELIPSIRQVIA
jgi:hypothetical protein